MLQFSAASKDSAVWVSSPSLLDVLLPEIGPSLFYVLKIFFTNKNILSEQTETPWYLKSGLFLNIYLCFDERNDIGGVINVMMPLNK